MKYIKLFENFEPNFDEFDGYLYHGTSSKHLDSILTSGLLNKSHWGSEEMANYYAQAEMDEVGGEPLIIKVPFNEFDHAKFNIDWPAVSEPITTVLGYDEEELADMWADVPGDGTWLDCLNIFQSVVYNGDILPTVENIL